MTTAQQIMTDALEMAHVVGVGQSIATADNTKALNRLNEMIASWKGEVDLQLDTLAAVDTVYLDASEILCLKTNLAALLCEAYGLPMPGTLLARATLLYGELVAKYLEASTEEMELPSLLIAAASGNIETDAR